MSRSLRGLGGRVDPIIATAVGGVLIVGGGLVAWGGGQDTEPVADQPAAALNQPQADATTNRALAAVKAAEQLGTGPVLDAADVRRAAQRATSKGRTADPFERTVRRKEQAARRTAATAATSTSTATAATSTSTGVASSTGSTSAAGSSGATGTGSTSTVAPSGTAVGGGTEADHAAAVAKARAARSRVSIRIVDVKGRRARSKLRVGTKLPSKASSIAQIAEVSEKGGIVTLRLPQGLELPRPQSKGTVCVSRFSLGVKSCRLVRVRAGKTVVLRQPGRRRSQDRVTALRILAVWRDGRKIAGL